MLFPTWCLRLQGYCSTHGCPAVMAQVQMGPLPTCAIPFGLSWSLMGLQPSGACRSWEDCALGDLGVSQTCLIVQHVWCWALSPLTLLRPVQSRAGKQWIPLALFFITTYVMACWHWRSKADEILFLEVYLGFLSVNKKIKVKGSSWKGEQSSN